MEVTLPVVIDERLKPQVSSSDSVVNDVVGKAGGSTTLLVGDTEE